jgi:hypothetical protein
MSVLDLYSRRKKLAEEGAPDVFVYDRVPGILRGQVQHIWDDALGRYWVPRGGYGASVPSHNNEVWNFLRNQLCREKGVLSLAGYDGHRSREDLLGYVHREKDVDAWLDAIELSFRYIDRVLGRKTQYERKELTLKQAPDDAIAELNTRFRYAAFGYRYEDGRIMRMDSELIHAEVVKPALRFLADPRFEGPRDEFRSAHGHYRAGELKDAITDANNAFESTMKAICGLKGWAYPAGTRASDLLKVIRAEGLLPEYLDASFDQLAATLRSGLPKVRNEEGSHGQGAQRREPPDYIAGYALHLAAAKIVLLFEAFRESEQRAASRQ